LAVALLVANLVAMAVHWMLLRSRFSERKILSDLREEVDKLVTDLGREADRDVELLEGRIRQLRELMAETDARILLGRKEDAKRDVVTLAETALTGPPPQVLADSGTRANREKRPEPGSFVAEKEMPGTSSPVSASRDLPVKNEPIMVYTKPMFTRSERQIEPVIPLNERVLDMARKGISADMIASTLAMSQGEVELIIDMNSSSL